MPDFIAHKHGPFSLCSAFSFLVIIGEIHPRLSLQATSLLLLLPFKLLYSLDTFAHSPACLPINIPLISS
ncbi:hypothetical protein ATANTOWER_005710 [Ataeniobius toweri]|uniref:Uncharacterized protein n=1 Tax=Ataeniobius toweri TaxID=208326 RepID=A0ABU7AMC5_9TELE|nr:hypothetical protein [Ataeniobius toweri]